MNTIKQKSIINFNNVSIGYKNKILIYDINLSVYQGDKILLLGSNGSGKTTLLKVLSKLKKPLKGKIHYYYKSIGYVPQSKTISDFPLRIYDVLNLYYPLYYPQVKRNQEIEYALKQVNLWEKRNFLLKECSGGELQRMYIARAILKKPEILILDEPLNAIDIQNKENFLLILEELYKQLQCTIIMTSHDLNEKIMKFFNKKIYISNHQIIVEL
ncbi:MAG: zinc import ATP-binding protein ZnuC [Leptospiraceae bacterium]|nr:MAG: zinc import ATP-binding protein ZnuC [Leptospiraceae bacterium]